MKALIIYTMIAVLSWTTMGCASNPNNMQPKHQTSLAYNGQECAVIAAELDAVNSEISSLNDELDRLYKNDIIQFWVGLLLLWPVWFFLEFGDWSQADHYKELLGQRDALERAKCS